MTTKTWKELFEEHGSGEQDAVIPTGTYDAEVEHTEATRAQSGREMIKARFSITTGPYEGRKLFTNIVVSEDNPTAMSIFFRQMKALGADGAFFATDPTVAGIAERILKRPCRVTVKHEEYGGETRAKVSNIAAPAGGVPLSGGGGGASVPPPPIPKSVSGGSATKPPEAPF